MKHYIPFIILTCVVIFEPTPADKGQDTAKQKIQASKVPAKPDTLLNKITILKGKSDSLRTIKKEAFKEEVSNLNEIYKKQKEKPKVIIQRVPIIIALPESNPKAQNDDTSLADDYLHTDSTKKKEIKKRTWLQRLFGTNK